MTSLRHHPEEDMQEACVRWFGYAHPRLAPLLHHSPNGGRRNVREAARFRAMGTRAGFPDLFLAVPNRGYHGLFIEMKSREGRQTPAQKEWQSNLTAQGYRYEVCRCLEEFFEIINSYLKA